MPQPGEAIAIIIRWNIVIDGSVRRYSSPIAWDNYYNSRNHYNKHYRRSKQPSRKRSSGPGIVLEVQRCLTYFSLHKNWARRASVHPPWECGGVPGGFDVHPGSQSREAAGQSSALGRTAFLCSAGVQCVPGGPQGRERSPDPGSRFRPLDVFPNGSCARESKGQKRLKYF